MRSGVIKFIGDIVVIGIFFLKTFDVVIHVDAGIGVVSMRCRGQDFFSVTIFFFGFGTDNSFQFHDKNISYTNINTGGKNYSINDREGS